MGTLAREAALLKFFLPCQKGLIEKESAPMEANSFYSKDPFQKGFHALESKHKVTKVVPLFKNGGKSAKYIYFP